MARVLPPEQFRQCPLGTVFAFGGQWFFGNLLILDGFVGPFEGGSWGFWAVDPMWVDADDTGEAFDRLVQMEGAGATKYMSYDGDTMDLFFVLDAGDWENICKVVEPAFGTKEKT